MACHLTNFLVRVPFLYKVDGSHGRFTLWSFLLVHIQFTTSEPKGFVILWFFKEIRPWKLDHEKWPSSMVRLHGPWCKHALSNPWANMLGSGFVALAPPYLCVCGGLKGEDSWRGALDRVKPAETIVLECCQLLVPYRTQPFWKSRPWTLFWDPKHFQGGHDIVKPFT